jgi:AraC-like DNA-binding protein/quercetin dioxygenase-like cupin family protein
MVGDKLLARKRQGIAQTGQDMTDTRTDHRHLPAVEPAEGLYELPRKLMVIAKHYPDGYEISDHSHYSAQLEYASYGVMKVMTERGVWIVPPQRAVFIPANMAHTSSSAGDIWLCNLLIQPDAAPGLPQDCCVVVVPPLLRELLLHAVDLPRQYEPGGPDERVMEVILDLVQRLTMAPLDLPLGTDDRLRRVYDGLVRDPADSRTLEEWGHVVGASERTLARLFRAQTGLGFRQWRQQFRILEAIERLGRGEPVTTVALDLGYESPSAFITMFKKALGKTPGQYLRG